ncbi:hypothetical protein KGF57_005282 [Candida theae]|uniref:Zn(2)-C6 fungal-type domain-containing protein n=1 Tax=Candida theae TaxID=1198502 RepID=A0AAD5FW99_9ASCO|nr:uncharacterized protein KGF57_005282 [Candida theae]KAI5948671.1 hypothetical protein KGF57_005282 [Candida theae]
MPQLPSVSELIGSTRVDTAASTTVGAFPPSSSYADYSHRKDSTTSISSSGIPSEPYRRQSTDQSRHQRLPSISNTISVSNSKRNSIDTSPRSSIHLPGVSYALVSRNENVNTDSMESLPSSRRSTESTVYTSGNNPAVYSTLPTPGSANSLPGPSFKFQQQQQQQSKLLQHSESQNAGIVRPPVGSPIGSTDKLQPLHMYISSPSTLHKPQPPLPSVATQSTVSHNRTNSNTVSPTHNAHSAAQGHEIVADNVDTSTVPQLIRVPSATPLHMNHGFPVSKSAPTSTTTTSYPSYFYHSVSSSDGPPAQNMQPPQPQPPSSQPPHQEHYYSHRAPQAVSITTHTPPPSTSSIQHQNPLATGPGYYVVQQHQQQYQQPQQIPLPPAAPTPGSHQQQMQPFAPPFPPHAVHPQASPYHVQAHYDPRQLPPPPPPPTQLPGSGLLMGLQPSMYHPYGVPFNDENQALMNKRKIIKRRTRTGCLTCRKRRIKCDERKPSCYNCERSKKVCLGYENLSNLQPRKRVRDTSLDLPTDGSGAIVQQQQHHQQQQQSGVDQQRGFSEHRSAVL